MPSAAITCVTLNRSRSFDTPVGLFSFTHVPQHRFLAGVRRIIGAGEGAFFLATPLKALADHVYAQRCNWQTAAPVIESLRVEQLSAKITEIDWMHARRDVQRFVRTNELPSLKLWTSAFFLKQSAKLSEQ